MKQIISKFEEKQGTYFKNRIMKKLIIPILLMINVSAFCQMFPMLAYYSNFENNTSPQEPVTDTINPWVIDTSYNQNIWQIGRPQKILFNSAYSVPKAIITDTIYPYPINNHSSFSFKIKKPYGMQNLKWTSMNFYFSQKINTDTLKDGGYVEISYNGGLTWSNIINDTLPIGIGAYNFYTNNDTLFNGEKGFSGNIIEPNWTFNGYNTAGTFAYNGDEVDSAIIRFSFISDSINSNKEGWVIDDILVTVYSDGVINVENNQLNKPDIKLYPNPVEKNLKLVFCNYPLNHNKLFKILNIEGKEIKSYQTLNNDEFTIDLSILDKGTYFIVCEYKNSFVKQKFIKN